MGDPLDAEALRVRSLELWCALSKLSPSPQVTLYMFEGIQAQATFSETDSQQAHFLLHDLQTPLGVYPSVLVSKEDVKAMSIRLEEGKEYKEVQPGSADSKN
eukprot:TRINITY_DN9542_c0_g1_i2.p1 TRINITY_DN9542_c0_g1~~TRINITY_DN9542_c0_g1_i2.p1  ORF type:complete len:102 (-),score=20.97 TRINITY_DN9542_c0_g1_i2:98-403(-)